jgi:hypothetical protein
VALILSERRSSEAGIAARFEKEMPGLKEASGQPKRLLGDGFAFEYLDCFFSNGRKLLKVGDQVRKSE